MDKKGYIDLTDPDTLRHVFDTSGYDGRDPQLRYPEPILIVDGKGVLAPEGVPRRNADALEKKL